MLELMTMVTNSGENGGSPPERMTISEIQAAERERVAAIHKRDHAEAKVDRKRKDAEREVKKREFGNFADTEILPTPELLRTGEFERVPAGQLSELTQGTSRTIEPLRRVQNSRIIALHARGVLDDDTFPACLWYRRAWEGCGFDLSPTAAAWGEQIGGDRTYGFGPKTPAQVEARQNFRFASSFIPDDMRPTFDRVVLEEMTIADAARQARCRYGNVTVMVKMAAFLLRGGIGHLLPVREVGAMGGEPVAPPMTADVPAPREAVPDTDPKFLDERGYLLPWAQIKDILHGREPGEEA